MLTPPTSGKLVHAFGTGSTAATDAAVRIHFGDCVIDTRRRELRVRARVVALQPRVYALLVCLVQHAGQVISKDDLLREVWRTTCVTDAVLSTAMLKLRRAIDDSDRDALMVATVHGVGYRFDASLRVEDIDAAPPGPPGPGATASDGPPGRGPAEALYAIGGRLAVLRFTNASDDVALDWTEVGLACLLHDRLGHAGRVPLLPLESSLQWRVPASLSAIDLAMACDALGTAWALSCRLDLVGAERVLSAWWGNADAQMSAWQAQGLDETALLRQLEQALLGVEAGGATQEPAPAASPAALGPPGGASAGQGLPSPLFWEGQLARVMDLHRRGICEQALALLQSSLPHLPGSDELTLLLARLLRERMALAQAREVLAAALAPGAGTCSAALRPRMLAEMALLCQAAGDTTAASQHCEVAMALIVQGDAPLEYMPEVLSVAARVDFDRGEYRLAARKAERAMKVAESMGDTALLIASSLGYARAMHADGHLKTARDALHHILVLAHGGGLVGLEADAYLRLAFLEADQWFDTLAMEYARRAAALASEFGDRGIRHRAQMREVRSLVWVGQLPEAEALWQQDVRETAGWDSPIKSANHEVLRFHLDWRLGRAESAMATVTNLLTLPVVRGTTWTNDLSYRLAQMNLCLGRPDLARPALAMVPMARRGSWRTLLEASLALAADDRPASKRLLRAEWMAYQSDVPEARECLMALAWMLMEDLESGDLGALMRDAAEMPREDHVVQLLMHVHELRSGARAWQHPTWCGLVRANAGLVHRHPWLLDAAVCEAWLRGAGPKLPVLLPMACF